MMDLEAVNEYIKRRYPTYSPIRTQHGQRHFGPPLDVPSSFEPPSGCEVFIGSIPRDIYEDKLIPLFMYIAPIYKFRLMIDFSGCNRGFAFVTYKKPEDADEACRLLNGTALFSPASSKWRKIGVVKSLDNRKLYVGGIPYHVNVEDLLEELRNQNVKGVLNAKMFAPRWTPVSRQSTRKFAFVEFENHYAAAMARRRLLPDPAPLWGDPHIRIDWAKPQAKMSNLPHQSVPSQIPAYRVPWSNGMNNLS